MEEEHRALAKDLTLADTIRAHLYIQYTDIVCEQFMINDDDEHEILGKPRPGQEKLQAYADYVLLMGRDDIQRAEIDFPGEFRFTLAQGKYDHVYYDEHRVTREYDVRVPVDQWSLSPDDFEHNRDVILAYGHFQLGIMRHALSVILNEQGKEEAVYAGNILEEYTKILHNMCCC